MNREELAELLASVRARPRMFLPDERYTTLVGFVTGCFAGVDGDLDGAFSRWLSEMYVGGPSSIVWWGQVGDRVDPAHAESRTIYGDLDEAASQPFNAELFGRLLEYLQTSKRSAGTQ